MLAQFKAMAMQAMKDKNQIQRSLLTVIIGDTETTLKGNKEYGNAQPEKQREIEKKIVLGKIKSLIVSIEECISTAGVQPQLQLELQFLRSLWDMFAPTQISTDELRTLIESAIAGGCTNIGAIMKQLNGTHSGQFDGNTARVIITELLQK